MLFRSVCLTHCRSSFDFVLNHWREGGAGAMQMGVEHGLYCLGCCWFLMALLFTAGIMSLLWMAAITAFVFVEKLFPAGQWIARRRHCDAGFRRLPSLSGLTSRRANRTGVAASGAPPEMWSAFSTAGAG